MKNDNILALAVENLDDDILDGYFEAKKKFNDSLTMRRLGAWKSFAATAACAVLVLGAALSIPKFISPGINDPSVPPVVSTEGSESEETEGSQFCMDGYEWLMACETKSEYSLDEEHVEIKVFYGVPMEEIQDSMRFWLSNKGKVNYIFIENFYLSVLYNHQTYRGWRDCDEHIIREFTAEDFLTEKYEMFEKDENEKNVVYMYSEILKIPTEVFKNNDNSWVALRLYCPQLTIDYNTLEKIDTECFAHTGIILNYEIKDNKLIMHNTHAQTPTRDNIEYIVKEK